MGIDFEDAARLVRICMRAREPKIPDRIEAEGVDLLVDQDLRVSKRPVDLDVRGSIFADRRRRRLIFVFRGIEFADGAHDVYHHWRPGTAPFRGCLLQSGAVDQYMALAPHLIPTIMAEVSAGRVDSIVCTGGSGGGAMALVAALDLAASDFDCSVSLRTFASPKVVNEGSAERVESALPDIVRFVNASGPDDPVPYWPPTIEEFDGVTGPLVAPQIIAQLRKGGRYVHVGQGVALRGHSAQSFEGTWPLDPSSNLFEMLLNVGLSHFLETYLELVEACIDGPADTAAWLPGVLATMMPPT